MTKNLESSVDMGLDAGYMKFNLRGVLQGS